MANLTVAVQPKTPKLDGLPNEILHKIWIFSTNLQLPQVSQALRGKLNDNSARCQVLRKALADLIEFVPKRPDPSTLSVCSRHNAPMYRKLAERDERLKRLAASHDGLDEEARKRQIRCANWILHTTPLPRNTFSGLADLAKEQFREPEEQSEADNDNHNDNGDTMNLDNANEMEGLYDADGFLNVSDADDSDDTNFVDLEDIDEIDDNDKDLHAVVDVHELESDIDIADLEMRWREEIPIPERFITAPFTSDNMASLEDMANLGAVAPDHESKVALLSALFCPGRHPFSPHDQPFSRFWYFFNSCAREKDAPLTVLRPAEIESILSAHFEASTDSAAEGQDNKFRILDRLLFYFTRTYRRMPFFDFADEPKMLLEFSDIENYPHLWDWMKNTLRVIEVRPAGKPKLRLGPRIVEDGSEEVEGAALDALRDRLRNWAKHDPTRKSKKDLVSMMDLYGPGFLSNRKGKSKGFE